MKNVYPLEIFYDAQCPICLWEVSLLRRRAQEGSLRFTPIDDAVFAPDTLTPSREQLFARIHARRADGVVIEGIDVFRTAYRAAGLGWLAAMSELPVLNRAAERAYDGFARHRHDIARHFGGLFKAMSGTECTGHCGLSR